MNAPRRVTTVPGRTWPSASSLPASHRPSGTSLVASTPSCSSVQYSPRPLAPGNRQLIPTMAMGSGELSARGPAGGGGPGGGRWLGWQRRLGWRRYRIRGGGRAHQVVRHLVDGRMLDPGGLRELHPELGLEPPDQLDDGEGVEPQLIEAASTRDARRGAVP